MGQHRICIVGSGYVGLVTGACLAEIGHRVVCVDSDKKKLALLKAGKNPIYEPGLDELIAKHRKSGALRFAGSIPEGLKFPGRKDAELVFIAVGTPPRANGSADLSYVEAVAAEVARNMRSYTVIVDKSTVPVETGEWVHKTVQHFNAKKVPFDVASNPEFLSEGTAVKDFLHPDRVVLGVSSRRAEELLRSIYAPLKAPVLVTDVKSAELIKHASNSFLATKISFINAVAILCEKTGADVAKVAEGMGLDRRIGNQFLRAGLGFGGFCFAPDEQVVLRDPNGHVHRISIKEAHAVLSKSKGAWDALSLDPRSNRMEFRRVAAMSRRPYDGLLVQISTKMGRKLRVTADHPMLVRKGDTWGTVTAAELTTADQLPLFLRTPEPERAILGDLVLTGAKGSAMRPRVLDRLSALKRLPAPAGYSILSSDVAAVRVTGLERQPYSGFVYSVEVEGNETIATGSGLVVHNCFPKDLEAFYWIAQKKGYDFKLLQAVKEINEHQKAWPIRAIESELWNLEGKNVAVLGLSFKPETDDLRFAPSLEIIAKLQEHQVKVTAYDPVAMEKAKPLLKGVRFAKDPYDAAKNADCLILVTEWKQFRELDFTKLKKLMRHPIVLDGRNFFDAAKLRGLGFTCRGVGRP